MVKKETPEETSDKLKPTAIWLPESMIERLQGIAGKRGMAEEVRKRLAASFAPEGPDDDPKTREMLADIRAAAVMVSAYRGRESQQWVHECMAEAIKAVVEHHRPREPEAGSQEQLQSAAQTLLSQPAITVGMVIATMVTKRPGDQRIGFAAAIAKKK